LLAVTLLVAFVYGYMVWGIFPNKAGISWESHLMGALSGAVLAIYYRKEGPPGDPEIEDFDGDDEESENTTTAFHDKIPDS
jgi:hypothetical protein